MGKDAMLKTTVFVPRSGDLRTSCAKLRGMTYLIEQCGGNEAPPLDEAECFYGIGLVMADIHDEVLAFARKVERWELYRAQKKKEKSGNQGTSSDVEDLPR